ncbi:MAG: hypothetical protein ABFC34_16290, partial [Methanobacterium sp.]
DIILIGFKNTFGKVKYCFSSNGHILLGTNVQQNRSEKDFLFLLVPAEIKLKLFLLKSGEILQLFASMEFKTRKFENYTLFSG